MKGNLLKAALVGGVIVFVWSMISWMVLPWHKMNMKEFKNSTEVSQAIMQNAPNSGIYPIMSMQMGDQMDQSSDQMMMNQQKPFASVVVKMEGMDYMSWQPYVISIIIQFITAFFIAWMLFQVKGLTYASKVGFVALIGLICGLQGIFMAWNWDGYPLMVAVIGTLDKIIGWGLAGLAMAKMVKK